MNNNFRGAKIRNNYEFSKKIVEANQEIYELFLPLYSKDRYYGYFYCYSAL